MFYRVFGYTGKGSSSISSDVSSGTDHTPTKAPRNVTASEGKASGPHYVWNSLLDTPHHEMLFFMYLCVQR